MTLLRDRHVGSSLFCSAFAFLRIGYSPRGHVEVYAFRPALAVLSNVAQLEW